MAVEGLRPTPDRVRETLFNWLQFDLAGARCLDLFAGSGILGFEAASRGAGAVSLIERDAAACQSIARSINALDAKGVELQRGDALEILATTPAQSYDIVFADPPFRQNLVSAAIAGLDRNAWVADGSKIYVEMESDNPLSELPSDWRLLKQGSAGDVAYYLCHKHSESF